METQFHTLPTVNLTHTTDLIHLEDRPQRHINLKSPAREVMTDLRVINPVSIKEDDLMEHAHALMISHAIRLLFVQNDKGQLTGLITASDILGEKPLQCMKEHGKKHSELQVKDIMTHRDTLEALDLTDVNHATVGQIVATMKHQGRQHELVIEFNKNTQHYEVCGIFSTSNIARHLGTSLNFLRVPQSFSEIQHTLLHAN